LFRQKVWDFSEHGVMQKGESRFWTGCSAKKFDHFTTDIRFEDNNVKTAITKLCKYVDVSSCMSSR
jgi:hypothetical protein